MSNGGTAFPCSAAQVLGMEYQPGMSLRDYFAAAAMQGIIGSGIDVGDEQDTIAMQVVASESYKMADAMLKARDA